MVRYLNFIVKLRTVNAPHEFNYFLFSGFVYMEIILNSKIFTRFWMTFEIQENWSFIGSQQKYYQLSDLVSETLMKIFYLKSMKRFIFFKRSHESCAFIPKCSVLDFHKWQISDKLITNPTRMTPTSCTLVDHIYIYTNFPTEKFTPDILMNDLSDHLPVFVFITARPLHKWKSKRYTKNDYNSIASPKFEEVRKFRGEKYLISGE